MDIILIIFAIFVLALVALVYFIYSGSKSRERQLLAQVESATQAKIKAEEQTSAREVEIRALLQESAQLSSRLEMSEQQLLSQQKEREALQQEFEKRAQRSEELQREQFKNIATEIFAEHTREFKSTNKESLDILLKPFKDNISQFRERVETIYSAENEQRGALQNELRNLLELNRKITTETTNLTNALKGNSKVQGDWGEMILETILDSSNLEKGIHYSTQYNIKDAEGNNLRPDVVLNLPDNKQIVIDSKTSLTAFVAYVEAQSEAERALQMEQHLKSVRQHVNELGRKEYQRLLDSPDFVIMFIPNEPAFLAALQADNTIWSDAYNKKVIISSPTNLFALLKLVDDLWKRNAQSKNTEAIVKNATKLFEQLVSFSTSLEDVGKALDLARGKFDDAHKRLHTGNDNIVRLGEKLRKLGLPTKKQLSAKMLEGNQTSDDENDN